MKILATLLCGIALSGFVLDGACGLSVVSQLERPILVQHGRLAG